MNTVLLVDELLAVLDIDVALLHDTYSLATQVVNSAVVDNGGIVHNSDTILGVGVELGSIDEAVARTLAQCADDVVLRLVKTLNLNSK